MRNPDDWFAFGAAAFSHLPLEGPLKGGEARVMLRTNHPDFV